MGMIGRVLGLGNAARQVGEAVEGVAEVFVGNRAERDAQDHEQFRAVLTQFGGEFQQSQEGWFAAFVNGMNRLPRPLLALGTLALFGYAMGDPAGFSVRMQGLALVPEPLWWLLGAIVSFYFGARELHYQRARKTVVLAPPEPVALPRAERPSPAQPAPAAPDRHADHTAVGDATPPAAAPPAAAPLPPRPVPRPPTDAASKAAARTMPGVAVKASDPHFNAALEEWRQMRG